MRVIVVGAGSAGAVLAARLSARPEVSVTLLEAGPDHRAADTPASISGRSFVAAKDEPGRFWPALWARRVRGQESRLYTRGRGVGGSSAINAMVALPGVPADYDDWVQRYGCVGWGWADMAPWFARTALTLNPAPRTEWGALNRAMAAVWGDTATGVPLTRDTAGRRVSVNDAYLEPVRVRPNLRIIGDTLVDRVLFAGRRAVGVRTAAGDELEADLVVVSAGAIHSPAVLLRSGVDTPGVGEGLQDHPSFPIAIARREPADLGGLAIATLARLPGAEGADDLQVLPIEHVDPALADLALVMAAAMRVHSRGRVTLRSNDPLADPQVEFDLLSDERDVAAVQRAIDAAEQLLDHPVCRAVGDVLPYDRSDAGVRAAVGDYVHAGGTCALGTVVDTECRVRGYDGLMVCDASVLPVLPRANTHLPTVAVAERVAALTAARLLEVA